MRAVGVNQRRIVHNHYYRGPVRKVYVTVAPPKPKAVDNVSQAEPVEVSTPPPPKKADGTWSGWAIYWCFRMKPLWLTILNVLGFIFSRVNIGIPIRLPWLGAGP